MLINLIHSAKLIIRYKEKNMEKKDIPKNIHQYLFRERFLIPAWYLAKAIIVRAMTEIAKTEDMFKYSSPIFIRVSPVEISISGRMRSKRKKPNLLLIKNKAETRNIRKREYREKIWMGKKAKIAVKMMKIAKTKVNSGRRLFLDKSIILC
jgi:hypothetical protein